MFAQEFKELRNNGAEKIAIISTSRDNPIYVRIINVMNYINIINFRIFSHVVRPRVLIKCLNLLRLPLLVRICLFIFCREFSSVEETLLVFTR